MNSKLTVLSLVAVLALSTCLGLAGTGVSMRINVPFSFYAGDMQMPAGEYTFEMGSGYMPTAAVVTVRAKTGIWLMTTKAGTDETVTSNQLLFNKYGDKLFLSSVSIQGFQAGMNEQKMERELRVQAEKARSTVIVAQK